MARQPTREELIQQDIQDLHRLGYAQQLFREMGGFSNFAISFSIISILTGAVLLYGYGLKFAGPIIKSLSQKGVQLNITAVMTLDQVQDIVDKLAAKTPAIVSVFAGRIADTGRDPVPLMAAAKAMLAPAPAAQLIWASPRELLNIFHAEAAGCDVITVTNDVLAKLKSVGKDLGEFSLETVKMFRDDAVKAGFKL